MLFLQKDLLKATFELFDFIREGKLDKEKKIGIKNTAVGFSSDQMLSVKGYNNDRFFIEKKAAMQLCASSKLS